jgi:HK97 family phage major capsid protein
MNQEILNLTKEISGDLNRIQTENTFNSHVEFLNAVRVAGMTGNVPEKLQTYNAVGSDEARTTSGNGDYMVPKEFFKEVKSTNLNGAQFDTGSLTTKIQLANKFSTIEIPARVDKDHSSSVSGGFRVYRTGEATEFTSSKAEYELLKLEARGLIGFSYASDELIRSSKQAFAEIVRNGFNTEFLGRLNFERIFGTGIYQYTGVMNSGALITVAKESNQTTKTINDANVRKMAQRAFGFANSIFMTNSNCLGQIAALSDFDARTFTLLGRPVVLDENMSTLGTLGDLLLANWSEYCEVYMGATAFDESIYCRFEERETAYRFVQYCDGCPLWRTALTPKNGTDTLSPFVTLAAR